MTASRSTAGIWSEWVGGEPCRSTFALPVFKSTCDADDLNGIGMKAVDDDVAFERQYANRRSHLRSFRCHKRHCGDDVIFSKDVDNVLPRSRLSKTVLPFKEYLSQVLFSADALNDLQDLTPVRAKLSVASRSYSEKPLASPSSTAFWI